MNRALLLAWLCKKIGSVLACNWSRKKGGVEHYSKIGGLKKGVSFLFKSIRELQLRIALSSYSFDITPSATRSVITSTPTLPVDFTISDTNTDGSANFQFII